MAEKTEITEDMIEKALKVMAQENVLPYSADVRDFTDEEVKEGKLRETDAECDRLNEEFVRRVLEAAFS